MCDVFTVKLVSC